MEYVYAALMLHKLKKDITEENVTSIVKASGTEVNEAKRILKQRRDTLFDKSLKRTLYSVCRSLKILN